MNTKIYLQILIGNIPANFRHTSDKLLTNIAQTKLAKKVFPGVETLMANPKWAGALSRLDKPTAKRHHFD